MGGKTEECKHVIGMKVSFRSALAIIVFFFFKVSTVRDPRTRETNPARSAFQIYRNKKATPLLQFHTIIPCYSQIKSLKHS